MEFQISLKAAIAVNVVVGNPAVFLTAAGQNHHHHHFSLQYIHHHHHGKALIVNPSLSGAGIAVPTFVMLVSIMVYIFSIDSLLTAAEMSDNLVTVVSLATTINGQFYMNQSVPIGGKLAAFLSQAVSAIMFLTIPMLL